MAYTHTTWAALRTDLANRLGDPNKTFWIDDELQRLGREALRTFGLLTGFWRERGTLATVAATTFYDINTLLIGTNGAILSPTITDQDLIADLEYHLLESTTSQSSWAGTEMFTLDDLTQAIQRRRDQFLSDTGIVLTRSLVNVASPPTGRETLADNIIDVRRASWLGASPFNYYQHLWREDETALTAFDVRWSINPDTPSAYSVMAPPPLELQLAPPPIQSGQLELITVNSGPALTPATGATVLGIPDDLCWIIKWGALADLLGKDGPARDLPRAQFAEARYTQGVALARMLPVIIYSELNGVALLPCTLQSLDAGAAGWQNSTGAPTDIAIAGANLIAIYPVPDDVYSITLDVVRRTPMPVLDADFVQVGREQLDMILDYAEHLALFKAGGMEWQATMRQAQNFLLQSITYNRRLGAAARYVVTAKEQSEREKFARPRRTEVDALGTLPSGRGADAQPAGVNRG